MSIRDRVEAVARRGLSERELRAEIVCEINRQVPFAAYVWLLTDPESSVGSLPLAEVPDLAEIPALIRLRYLTATNRWSDESSSTVSTLVNTTAGQLSRSPSWAQCLARHCVTDVVTINLRDQYGRWGFVDLWRMGGSFSPAECAALDEAASTVTTVVRQSLLPTFDGLSTPTSRPDGPAIVLLDDDMDLLTQTAQANDYVRALLPPVGERTPVPAAVYNVAAQLLAREASVDEHPAEARLPLDGRWLTARAARTEPGPSSERSLIAVSIEVATPAERTSVYARVAGLSDREQEVLAHLVNGSDTRVVANRLFVSEHTVHDHLKSIFKKTGVNNRKALVARATGAA